MKKQFSIKTSILYVPNNLNLLLSHAKIHGVNITKNRGARLLELYEYICTEEDGVAWPYDRNMIRCSLQAYNKHSPTVLNNDIGLLIKLEIIQCGEGELRRSLTDMFFENFM